MAFQGTKKLSFTVATLIALGAMMSVAQAKGSPNNQLYFCTQPGNVEVAECTGSSIDSLTCSSRLNADYAVASDAQKWDCFAVSQNTKNPIGAGGADFMPGSPSNIQKINF